MNREEIIRMAKKAGGDDWGIFKDFMPEIERFAALVAAIEREACAKVCEQLGEEYAYASEEHCAEAIRARGSNV